MSRPSGMTLLEVLIGSVVVATVVISAGYALGGATDSEHLLEEESVDAALIAKEICELALRQDTAANGDPAATDAAGVKGLDSLDGASFCPPLDASLGALALSSPGSWRQVVDLQTYGLSDLETPSSQAFTGAADSSSTLFRLSVQVTFRGQDKGTWWWWINP